MPTGRNMASKTTTKRHLALVVVADVCVYALEPVVCIKLVGGALCQLVAGNGRNVNMVAR